jgi:hypothetical protein
MLTNQTRGTIQLIKNLFILYLRSTEYGAWCTEKLRLSDAFQRTNAENFVNSFLRIAHITNVSQSLYFSSRNGIPEASNDQSHYWYLLKLGSMLEDVPVVAYITVPDAARGFPILYCNNATETTTGFARYLLLGKPCPFFAHSQENETKDVKTLVNGLLHSEPKTSQLIATYSDGSLDSVLIRNNPLCDRHGRHLFTLSVQTKLGEEFVFDIVSAIFASVPQIISSDDFN